MWYLRGQHERKNPSKFVNGDSSILNRYKTNVDNFFFFIAHSYCIIGNPKWIGKPSLQPVENVSTSILITWHGKIRNAKGNGRDCTDNFRIKYWPTIDSNNYTLTELLENTLRQFEIENLLPGTNYAFQVTKMYYYHI